MSGAEGDACDDDAECPTAQPHIEPVKHERPLHFFAYAARDDDNEPEERRLPRRADQVFQRIVRHRMQRGREPLYREQDGNGDSKCHKDERQAHHGFTADRPAPDKNVGWTFTVGAEKEDDQCQQERRISQ